MVGWIKTMHTGKTMQREARTGRAAPPAVTYGLKRARQWAADWVGWLNKDRTSFASARCSQCSHVWAAPDQGNGMDVCFGTAAHHSPFASSALLYFRYGWHPGLKTNDSIYRNMARCYLQFVISIYRWSLSWKKAERITAISCKVGRDVCFVNRSWQHLFL